MVNRVAAMSRPTKAIAAINRYRVRGVGPINVSKFTDLSRIVYG
jgi:hypothetical protein